MDKTQHNFKKNIIITIVGLILSLLVLFGIGIYGTLVMFSNPSVTSGQPHVEQEKTAVETDEGYVITTPLLNPFTQYIVGVDFEPGIYVLKYSGESNSVGDVKVYPGSTKDVVGSVTESFHFQNDSNGYIYNNLILEEEDVISIHLENNGQYELIKIDELLDFDEEIAGSYKMPEGDYTLSLDEEVELKDTDYFRVENTLENGTELFYIQQSVNRFYLIHEFVYDETGSSEIIRQIENIDNGQFKIKLRENNMVYFEMPYSQLNYKLEYYSQN